MPLKIANLRLPVEEPESSLEKVLTRRLRLKPGDLQGWRILRKSLDARTSTELQFVYSAIVQLPDERAALKRIRNERDIFAFAPESFYDPPPGQAPLSEQPVIIGSGPAGLLAAYYLAWKGFRPLILERGQPVRERVAAIRTFDQGGSFDRENNYLFGEGGAGCFSDGKLTCRISGPDVDWVLERFVECGGRSSLVYEHRPHLGSNKLPMICRNFRRRIEALGGEYRFGCCAESIDIREGRVCGVQTSSGYIPASRVILAIGHSARDTYEMLHRLGVVMTAKAFQLGLRIEHPQEQVNRKKYGRKEYLDVLGAADYSLVARGERDLYTFCMCAGGIVIPSVSEPKMFCTNGMSNSRHDTPFANSGLVVTLEPQEFGGPSHPLSGVELQRQYESAAFQLTGGDYLCPIQSVSDFLADRTPGRKDRLPTSYRRGVFPLNLSQVLPPVVAGAIRAGLPIMDRKWRGGFIRDAVLVGPEMRGSSPVRIERDPQSRQSLGIDGLYPVGEGAGYAGGIVTAAIDGLRTAKVVVEKFAPLRATSGN